MKLISKLVASMVLMVALISGFAMGQSKIKGFVTDASGTPLPLTRINLLSDGVPKDAGMTDVEGKYEFSNIAPGTYDLQVIVAGETFLQKGIVVAQSETRPVDVIAEKIYDDKGIQIVERAGNAPPIFSVDPIKPITVTREVQKETGVRNINDLVGTFSGAYQNGSGALQFRGGRQGTTAYFIDGVKVVGVPGIPAPMYGQITTFAGGLPAQYGDVSGGVVVVDTWNRGMKGWFGEPARKSKNSAEDVNL